MTINQQIHSTAKIMQGVVLEGDVTIGANTYIGAGAVITCNGGTIDIGSNTVIMENAIIRASAKFNCVVGDHVLIGPKACITGAAISNGCFIATNATVFHGSVLEEGSVIAVNGIVHIATRCGKETFVPINHIAFGNPVKIYSPAEVPQLHADLNKLGFSTFVYDIDTTGLSRLEIYTELTRRFLQHNNPNYRE